MKIIFEGAAQTVTGSRHLIEVNGHKILLDCGLFQGKRDQSYIKNQNFEFDPASLDAVILSHAHIDHNGNLPNLVKNGYHGPIYATPPTVTLGEIMLQDSAHIQEQDALYVNKKRAKRGLPAVEPLYTLKDALEAIDRYYPVKYEEAFSPVPGVTVRFFNAGHILGSAAIRIDVDENGQHKSLWFSGDIGRKDLPLLPEPVFPSDVDYLLMECTYGDENHDSVDMAYEKFKAIVVKTVQRGGKIIIPAFAVGRTQEIVYFLNMLISEGAIAPLSVYVDSPLAVAASKIFRGYPEYFDEETFDFIRKEKHPALDFTGLRYVSSVEESKALNDKKGPLVIISASGMAEAGRILHHLKNNIEDQNNTVLICGWQAPNTLGRRLVDRDPIVRIFGEEYDLRAEVVTINGLSAHAGQDYLLQYAAAVKGRVKKIFLVHGEEEAATIFQAKLNEAGIGPVEYPTYQQEVEI
ncbi:MAG: MBL fold metallo-hydrolase [Chloroflexi bacterium HGW-Chloroflexi-4]|jgi:metallo-beta-lactamase family protein|nr:MAG: MBL fold metallo-hydrolase [Chloroflexi bacterium HGW-Chloroflexi-4]